MKRNFKKVKWCWVATETRKGWRVKLAIGNKYYPLSGLLLDSESGVKFLIKKGNIVFIHLKDK